MTDREKEDNVRVIEKCRYIYVLNAHVCYITTQRYRLTHWRMAGAC